MKLNKKFINRILLISILTVILIPFQHTSLYALDNIHWAETYYNELKQKEILNDDFEYSNNTYDYLNTYITREEFFSLIIRTLNLSTSDNNILNIPFSDKNTISNSLSKYIITAYENNILEGVEENGQIFLYPKRNITRQEACTILSRSFNIYYYDKANYLDNNQIQAWAQPSVSALTRAGILNGYQDNYFKPNRNLTRAEAFKIINYCINLEYEKDNQIVIFAGTGESGQTNGSIKDSSFSGITDIVKDDDSNIYVADSNNNSIRLIKSNQVSDFAGNKEALNILGFPQGGYEDGKTNEALFSNPYNLAIHNDVILISDRNNKAIRFIKNGYTYTLECKGIDLELPSGITIDNNENIYVSDTAKNIIYKINKDGNASIFAGNEQAGFKDDKNEKALFNEPTGLLYHNNAIYVADTGNHAIRIIKDGEVTTIAGGKNYIDNDGIIYGDYLDTDVKNALFSYPTNIEIADDGTIYIADTGNSMIRKIKDGMVTTIAGLKNAGEYLVKPMGMILSDNKLYVADNFSNRIYIIDIK